MKHPMASSTLLYKEQENGTICVTDSITKNEAIMTRDYVRFLRCLDGKTDPYKVRNRLTHGERDAFIDAMKSIGFLRSSRVLAKCFGTIILTLWVPRVNNSMDHVARVFERLLKLLWIPILTLGASLFWINKDSIFQNSSIGVVALLGWFSGMISGVLMHEIAHAFSAVANDIRLFEGGVLIHLFMPGAYVAIDEEHISSIYKKVRIYSAGVQMNYLLAGISALIMVTFGPAGGFWPAFSLMNLLLALPNTLFVKGFDGYKILLALLGKRNDSLLPIIPYHKNGAADNSIRTVSILANVMILVWQITLPIMIIYNVAVFF